MSHALRRTGAPIRRHSRNAGRCEVGFWRPFSPKDTARYMLAAERFERAERKPGKRSGPLGPVGLEVLRELLRLIDYRTGRLEPSITYLMERLRRSRDAVVRALASLRGAGFLDWLRRWEPTGKAGEAGPQVKQTSNAYRLSLPPAAARLIGWLAKDAPRPVDDEARQAGREAERAAMLDGLPLWEQGSAAASGALGAALDKLGLSVAGRESAKQTESNPKRFTKGVGLTANTPSALHGR